MRPQTRYAKAGDVHIAYQVFGSGPFDVVFVPGMLSHVDYWWEEPRSARFFRRLASFARVILFEKRGLGASDRSSDWAPLEERMNDLKGHVEYEARDHAFWIHPDPVGAALQEFLTGTPVEPEPDRVLAAVRGVPGEWRLLALRSDDSNARLS